MDLALVCVGVFDGVTRACVGCGGVNIGQLGDAFGDLVETLARSGPLVIGADDLQWADPSSLLTVAAMARRLPGLPVAIIGCLRPVPRSSELDGLIRALQAAGARQLTLPPLGAEAVRELTCEAVAAEPGPGLLSEISGAAGNPLFVTELLGALLQEGAIKVADGRSDIAEARLPPSLRLTNLRRISFLPEDTIQLLQVASVLGSAFSLTDLALISGLAGDRADQSADRGDPSTRHRR